jgi:hypothetical protein
VLNRFYKKARRIPGKIKLILLGFPIINWVTQFHYRRRLAAFADSTPRLSVSAAKLVGLVNREGVVRTSIEELALGSATSLLESVDRLLPELQTDNSGQENSIRLSHEHIIRCQGMYLWGLDEKLLDVAENHHQTERQQRCLFLD